MVAFKRFFQAEKSPSGSPGGDTRAGSLRHVSLPSSKSGSIKSARSRGVEQQFHKIEKQFEVMHDQLQARPMSPRSQAAPSRGSSRLTERTPRHVDLLDALFSSHRYHMQSTTSLSPTTPYNEDIAERNMTQFLQCPPQPPPPKKNVYSRLVSALYQEDVADRNISRNKSFRSLSRRKSGRSRGRSFQSTSQYSPDSPGSRPRSRADENQASTAPLGRAPSSKGSSAEPVEAITASRQTTPNGSPLRQQRSAPMLLSEQQHEPKRVTSEPTLQVPPSYKQGKRWSNTPLPDSPTLPMMVRRDADPNENQPVQETQSKTTRNQNTSPTPQSHRPPMAPRSGSKKNVRDLSIDTELASRGHSTKIGHRAIQPPTPSNYEMKQTPNIAEVMNSPLPAATPTSLSPLPPTDQKIAEIMDMFRQAYSSTQAVTPHPTFETLQDAIIREINSHEAFQRVPVPNQGPPFTPSPTQACFDRAASGAKSPAPGSTRTLSLKDSQLSKLIRRGSFKKHRGGSEANRSISTSVPSKVLRRPSEATTPTRRRHTDAPPPSPGFFDSMVPQEAPREEPVTYMDILLRSQKSAPGFPSRPNPVPEPPKNLGHSHSLGTVSLHSASDAAASPSVYYMRAQTSASSSDSHPSFSVDDSDEEVIQLPSVGIPHVQIQGVDENNVTYIAENTTPQNAYRLMNWPQKARRSVSLRGHVPAAHENRHQHQHHSSRPSSKDSRNVVRGARSVESY
ncbi:predicted protein [Aspergillus terreus NIH2624]|uniref:Uncharacterized protein n=1 Tax=Aspergillus terreus (strain NIH 2624 / FGSC A1156) TaxID=341663 RepID=Q0CVE0_ASPTN|nr:uncharacterized protein ATEG_02344 [Aspergillus terreus NIH2624]EAU37306.1 predicted protein [Aspergillus terreus NIH2624]